MPLPAWVSLSTRWKADCGRDRSERLQSDASEAAHAICGTGGCAAKPSLMQLPVESLSNNETMMNEQVWSMAGVWVSLALHAACINTHIDSRSGYWTVKPTSFLESPMWRRGEQRGTCRRGPWRLPSPVSRTAAPGPAPTTATACSHTSSFHSSHWGQGGRAHKTESGPTNRGMWRSGRADACCSTLARHTGLLPSRT